MRIQLLFLLYFFNLSFALPQSTDRDPSTLVKELNFQAAKDRLISPEQSILKAKQALKLAQEIHFQEGIVESLGILGTALQNKALSHQQLQGLQKAKKLLNQARLRAKSINHYNAIANIDLPLANLYFHQKDYSGARNLLKEGIFWAKKAGDKKLQQDYQLTFYFLENKLGNYQKAMSHLKDVYHDDSLAFRNLDKNKITSQQEQFELIEKQQQAEILLEKQRTDKNIKVATGIVLLLSLTVIILLIVHSRKRAKTVKQLQDLNEEILSQKEALRKLNLNQEEIIKERTADLEKKNIKLSQYSSHLSHEIRSPISSIKGLLILEQEKLIEDKELIREIRKCVEDIDNKLLNINQMLHNPKYRSFILSDNVKDKKEPPPASD